MDVNDDSPFNLKKMKEELIPSLFEGGRKVIEEGEELQPGCFFITNLGVLPVEIDFSNEATKAFSMRQVRLKALLARQLFGLHAVILITDSYQYELPMDADISTDEGYEEAKQRATRYEALLYNVQTYFGNVMMEYRYRRLEDGRIAWDPPVDLMEKATSMEGRMVDLLPPLPDNPDAN